MKSPTDAICGRLPRSTRRSESEECSHHCGHSKEHPKSECDWAAIQMGVQVDEEDHGGGSQKHQPKYDSQYFPHATILGG
jgi:hypothetical protein